MNIFLVLEEISPGKKIPITAVPHVDTKIPSGILSKGIIFQGGFVRVVLILLLFSISEHCVCLEWAKDTGE